MAITVSDIQNLLGRYAQKIINKQGNLAAPFLDSKQHGLEEAKHDSEVGIVHIQSGGGKSMGTIADGGTLYNGGQADFYRGTYLPIPLIGRLTLPRAAVHTGTGRRDAVNLVKEEMEQKGRQLGRMLCRLIIDGGTIAVGTVVSGGTTADLTAVITQTDPSAFRVGDAFERTTSGGTFRDVVQVTDMAWTNAGQANLTITVVEDSSGTTVALFQGSNVLAGDLLRFRGSNSQKPTSLADVTADADLYGITKTNANWNSNRTAVGGAFAVSDIRAMNTLIKRRTDMPPNCLLSNSVQAENYVNAVVTNNRWIPGMSNKSAPLDLGTGGKTLEFDGLPWVVDESVGDGDIYVLNKDHLKLAVWRKFAPDFDGKKAQMVSASTFTYDTQIFGLYNLRCTRRSSQGRLSGITD